MSFVRFQSTSTGVIIDDQRLRDYHHRLFDICYQINGMFFAHDIDLYHLKLNENYFLSTFLQRILFENLNTLPSFRLRIVLRHFCRSFVEHYCSSSTMDKEIINELFLQFLDIFLPYIQQRLTSMWNNLLSTTINIQQGECSDEVIEECVCVLLTRDFVDIIRYFIYKTSPSGSNNSSSSGMNKNRKNKTINGHNHNDSMCDENNGISGGYTEQIDEWDEQATMNSISNKLLNGTQEKMDYSDLFTYMIRMSRQSE